MFYTLRYPGRHPQLYFHRCQLNHQYLSYALSQYLSHLYLCYILYSNLGCHHILPWYPNNIFNIFHFQFLLDTDIRITFLNCAHSQNTQQTRNRRKLFNLINGIYEKATANIILNGGKHDKDVFSCYFNILLEV